MAYPGPRHSDQISVLEDAVVTALRIKMLLPKFGRCAKAIKSLVDERPRWNHGDFRYDERVQKGC